MLAWSPSLNVTKRGSSWLHTPAGVFSFSCKVGSRGPTEWSRHHRCLTSDWSTEGWGQKKNPRLLPLPSSWPRHRRSFAPRACRTTSRGWLGGSAASSACWGSREAGAAWSAAAQPDWVRTTSAPLWEVCRCGRRQSRQRVQTGSAGKHYCRVCAGWRWWGHFVGRLWWAGWFWYLQRQTQTLLHLW